MNYFKIGKQTIVSFLDKKPMSISSSIAFYLILSLPAILMIVMSVASAVFDDAIVRASLIKEIGALFGDDSATAVAKILDNTQDIGSTFVIKVISIGALIFSSTTVFISLQEGLNSIWGVKAKPEKNLIKFLLNRLVSFAMIVSLSFLLIVSLALDAIVAILNENVFDDFTDTPFLLIKIANVLISFFITTGVISVILKVLPEVHIKWSDVWSGAILTTILFTVGKYLIGVYLGGSSFGTIYGAAGSLVLLLIWVYYSSLILLLGAQFTFIYTMETGREVQPYDQVVVVKEIEVDGYNVM